MTPRLGAQSITYNSLLQYGLNCSGVDLCSRLGERRSENRRVEARGPKGLDGGGVLGLGAASPLPHELRVQWSSVVRGEARPLLVLVFFWTAQNACVNNILLSLKTRNLAACLLSLSAYGTYVNVYALHICRMFINYRYLGPSRHTHTNTYKRSFMGNCREMTLWGIDTSA